MITAALSVDPNWKQPKSPKIGEYYLLWYNHTMEYSSVIKRALMDIMLRGKKESSSQKVTYYKVTYYTQDSIYIAFLK